jgi:hypothetical protein
MNFRALRANCYRREAEWLPPGRLAHPNTRVLISTGLALRERGTLLVPADLPQTTEWRAREWAVAVGTLLHPARNRPGMVSTVER